MRRRPIGGNACAGLAAVLLVAACGASDDDAAPVVDPADAVETIKASDAASGGKPEVQVPEVIPTELTITDLIDGTGPEADVGDTVIVDYVGVRSEDGSEFDNSYDRGRPFPVQLGTGRVIEGWEQGLIGARAGMRRQLDIPAGLAYGDNPPGAPIQPGDTLTFVIDVVVVEKPPEITAPQQADEAACAIDEAELPQQTFEAMQPFCIDPTRSYTAEIITNFGPITVELLPQRAPQTVNNFVMLARHRYFDDTQCHRAIPDFVVQCGDPTATGTGGPGYRFADELPAPDEYRIGSLAMANSGPDSNGSQFFIITGDNGAALPPRYSLFGRVVDGLDTTVPALDAVANPADNGVPPLETIIIESVTITEA